jgi:hypothetical protein
MPKGRGIRRITTVMKINLYSQAPIQELSDANQHIRRRGCSKAFAVSKLL